ncbi:MAG: DoxX family protein [Candidatus Nitronauta litoralis]|uniref:DoxX family protein n=1 Tax=Candidatus Nitronauta litoralis TaxID=2705533 RepID=A0A7T0BZ92_9BACT|nr:MAG: DoxX family protein [Candidatus Nitronauta litoralis]
MEQLRQLFETDDGWDKTILRLVAGGVMFPHGAQKLLGWFGGYGFNGTMGFFTDTMGMPWIMGFTVIMVEFFASLALIAGALTRLSALGISVVMAGAVTVAHWQNGFFMNWANKNEGEGFEYHLLMIGMCGALLIGGGGKASLDRMVFERLKA